MEEEIKINDKTYVLKTNIKETNIGIRDSVNVSMLFKIDEEWFKEDGNILELPKPEMIFQDNGNISECSIDFNMTKLTTKAGTIIGYEFYKYACRMVNAMSLVKNINKKIEFTVYEGWNKETKTYNKDYPIFLTDGIYGVLIAPRVENG